MDNLKQKCNDGMIREISAAIAGQWDALINAIADARQYEALNSITFTLDEDAATRAFAAWLDGYEPGAISVVCTVSASVQPDGSKLFDSEALSYLYDGEEISPNLEQFTPATEDMELPLVIDIFEQVLAQATATPIMENPNYVAPDNSGSNEGDTPAEEDN